MKKYTILTSLIILSISTLQAQIKREVEVVNAYIPVVEKATKPLLPAVIADTAYIYPDVDYAITPLSINTPLQTKPISPATITYWEFNRPATAQLKVGAGLPLNSLLDAYASTHNASVGYLSAGLNHRGKYSDIQDINATEVLNNIDLSAGLYIAGRTLRGSASYYNDSYRNYASVQIAKPNINFQQLRSSLSYGDNFVNLTKLNYYIDGEYSHFFDHRSNINNELKFRGDLARSFSLGNAFLSFGYNDISNNSTYNNQLFTASALLNRDISNWRLNIGVDYTYDKTALSIGSNESANHVMPRFSIYNTTAKSISPFLDMGGEVTPNNYAALSQINPYVSSDVAIENTAEYYIMGGIVGRNKLSTLSYRLYVGHTIGHNDIFWKLNQYFDGDNLYRSLFDVDTAGLNTTSFDMNLDYSPLTNLTLKIDGHYYLYSMSEECDCVNSRPEFNASVGIEYLLRKFKAGINTNVIGPRSYAANQYALSQVEHIVERIPTVVDISAFIEWQASKKVSVFAEGSNLCGSKLYPWPMYKGFGASVTAGVKINFR